MAKVVALMSMSLDGYVADEDDGVAEVFDWYFSGDVEIVTASATSGMTFHVSPPSADHLRSLMAEIGAMLTGRRTFEKAGGWDGRHPFDVPAFVATHHVPEGWPRPGSTVHFVTDGIESAVGRAKAAAGEKSVGVHGAQTIQQCLDAGLLDEIHVDLTAVLLGAGVRLFDNRLGHTGRPREPIGCRRRGCHASALSRAHGVELASVVAHYLFNLAHTDPPRRRALREEGTARLRLGMWGVDAGERHRDALAAGDLILVYLSAPARTFIGRAALASPVHDWTPAEARAYPGDSSGGVLLAQVEEWDPPVPMDAVLSRIDASEGARGDFETGVVRITANEYETALAVAAGRATG